MIRQQKPWKQDIHYFKKCKISAVALIKMVMHARSGGNLEVFFFFFFFLFFVFSFLFFVFCFSL